MVIDQDDRLLMFRFDVQGRDPFWVTAGGECDPEENFIDAARRELFEETGIDADPGEQIARICPEFVTVEGEPVQADERYFRVYVRETRIDTSNHTELEKRVMQEHRWFTQEELRAWPEAIFPENIAELMKEDQVP